MPRRVLVIDDDYDLRMLCASVLRAAGVEVLAAASAEAGVDLLGREACDLVILDLKLPGMSGLDALEVIAAKWPRLPVLVASASGEATEAEARVGGARGLLIKPFSTVELLAKVEEVLASAGGLESREKSSRRTDTVMEIASECGEHIAALRARLAGLRESRHDPGLLDETYRSACAAKGLLDFLDLPEATDAASRLANGLRRLRDGEEAVTEEAVAELEGVLCGLADTLLVRKGGASPSSRVTRLPLDAVLAGAPAAKEDTAPDVLVAELGRCLPMVLSDFGAHRVKCCEVVQRRLSRSTAELTVAIDLEFGGEHEQDRQAFGPRVGAVLFAFEPRGARALAEAITMSTVGEQVGGSPEEQADLVEGALGEMANRAASAATFAAGCPVRISGPYVFRGAGVQLCAVPQTLHCFHVDSDIGDFEAGVLAGAILRDQDAGRTERGEPGQGRRVLLVHPSAVMRKMLRRTFEGAGFEVAAEARDGRPGVEKFRTVRPDLVVLALNMPVMGGLDALRIIRADEPHAKVLICSAMSEGRAIRRGLRAGAVGYVTTPFEPGTLIRTVEELFRPHEHPAAPGPDVLGLTTLGAYRVGELLAHGGMADVYRGYDPGLGREVALKVMKDELARDVDFVVQFLNEARAVASVNHPNVVSIYFAGSDRGKHFFAMEFLPGPDLEYLVKRESAVLSEHEALEYISQAAGGLAAANRHGLIHCDVKPSNLVLGADGLLKVTDFGIARHASASAGRVDSGPFGTPAYSSPEQTMGGQVDHRSDIYSLGATLHFLIAGAPPYEGGDEMEAILRHVHDPVPRLKGASRRVNKLLARMMSKSPDARHATYEELIAEIGRLV